tara:strand:- start:1459 stop:1665 length:207 start_codon:yes stop_codon:yes gene_type:complete
VTALPLFFKMPVSRPVLETSFYRVHMAKVIIELEQGDLMELAETITEIKDSLIRIEGLLKDIKEKENG